MVEKLKLRDKIKCNIPPIFVVTMILLIVGGFGSRYRNFKKRIWSENMKQPELIIDKEVEDLPKHIIPYTYRQYCPICGKISMEWYVYLDKKTGLYEFSEPNKDAYFEFWEIIIDMVKVVASEKNNRMLFDREEIEKEEYTGEYVVLSDEQFKLFSMNKSLFYKILKEKLNKLYPKKRVQGDDAAINPNFCSKECIDKFIISIIEEIKGVKT